MEDLTGAAAPLSFAALIFDLDGVLVDSEPLHNRAWEELFTELGVRHNLKLALADYYGKADRVFLRDLLAAHDLPHSADELHDRKLRYLLRHLRETRPIFAGLRLMIPALAGRWPLGIASLSSHRVIDTVLEIAGWRPYFKVVVGAEDIRHPKPDPEIYLTAAGRLGVAPGACCVIEDSSVGVQAGKAAGMTVIGLATGLSPAQLRHADYVVRDHTALGQLLGG